MEGKCQSHLTAPSYGVRQTRTSSMSHTIEGLCESYLGSCKDRACLAYKSHSHTVVESLMGFGGDGASIMIGMSSVMHFTSYFWGT